ncbi:MULTISPECIES: hypothetical protein [Virgibacillus]|uniref:Uncharacterized protein n=1 Tax=Virgibacillus massiliensis TaxID=1462526 RepID=A0A024Q7G6_9BACI|nr:MULTISPECIES: hypothetical protein [Virgibacillus]EQB38258.1 hypothetical protein M948_06680 [Virgibacillus sp. CM-4]MYL40964.1 hypothetical protein [Virgibacillus massiliensis]CDQ38237.1 hypothetical protein BN990_00506 [Virgibacillus massiliensis]
MYKIIAIGTNNVRAKLAIDEEEMIFETYEEAEQFLQETDKANILPDNYQLVIEEQ